MTDLVRRWQFASEVERVSGVVEEIVTLCRHHEYPARQCQLNVTIAVTEAITNAILRGNGGDTARQVSVQVAMSAQQLVVDVSDEGSGFDLASVQQSPDDPDWFERERGRGIFLMRSLTDGIESMHVAAAEHPRFRHRLRLILRRS